jgi:hypothetical protein
MLDIQDQNIVDALAEGKSEADIMSEFGVDQAKIDQLRSVGTETAEVENEVDADPVAGAEEVKEEETVDAPVEEVVEDGEAVAEPVEDAPVEEENKEA